MSTLSIYRKRLQRINQGSIDNLIELQRTLLPATSESKFGVLHLLLNLLWDRDPHTLRHSFRVQLFTDIFTHILDFSSEVREQISEGALLHDIGKLTLLSRDINQRSELLPYQYEVLKSHTSRGKWLLQPLHYFDPILDIVYYHHERWDGRGYPIGLSGENIPLWARIVSITDTYDAMISNRAYRKGLSHQEIIEEFTAVSGTQFDPQLIDLFLLKVEGVLSQLKPSKEERWDQYCSPDVSSREVKIVT